MAFTRTCRVNIRQYRFYVAFWLRYGWVYLPFNRLDGDAEAQCNQEDGIDECTENFGTCPAECVLRPFFRRHLHKQTNQQKCEKDLCENCTVNRWTSNAPWRTGTRWRAPQRRPTCENCPQPVPLSWSCNRRWSRRKRRKMTATSWRWAQFSDPWTVPCWDSFVCVCVLLVGLANSQFAILVLCCGHDVKLLVKGYG